MTRTFIALELNEALQRHLSGHIRSMARELPSLRWVNPTEIHLTLAFLGELSTEQLALAMQATEQAARAIAPFDYRLTHLGSFGSPRSVLWVGIAEPSGRLQQLHRLLNSALEQRAFAVDKRPFSPHLTLSRIKKPLKPEEQAILQQFLDGTLGSISSPPYHVQHLSVMKSDLSSTGARYTCLHNYAFLHTPSS